MHNGTLMPFETGRVPPRPRSPVPPSFRRGVSLRREHRVCHEPVSAGPACGDPVHTGREPIAGP